MNPYSGLTFFEFLAQLMIRFGQLITGQISYSQLVSDEIQVLVLMGVAASSALVGSFLVLRKMTMLANSLSHTILLGIVMAFVLTRDDSLGHQHSLNIQVMLLASLVMGLLTAFLTEFLTNTVRLQEDASTGLVFTSLFALGIILVTVLTRNAHIGTEVVMGNVDALHIDDLKLIFIILFLNIFLFVLFFKEFKITTFDPALAKAFGFSTTFFNYLLMVQVSATSIGAFRAVGVLMVLAFITGPVLSARLLTHDLKRMLFLAVFLGVLASVIGVALSRHLLSAFGLAFSTGGLVVCVIIVIFLLAVVLHFFQRKLSLDTITQDSFLNEKITWK